MPLDNPPKPQEQQSNPYLPPGPPPMLCEEFAGINTSSTRAGVDDKQLWWSDGFFLLNRRNMRTLYGVGPLLYTAPAGTTIVLYGFTNIAANPYAIVFLSNGRVDAVRTDTGATATILSANTILNPSIQTIGLSQWGRQYVLIVSSQLNGYWIWDGTLAYTAGTLGPGVVLTNVGSGYQTVPSVTASGGHGLGATFTATIANGIVVGVSVTNPGSGYLANDVVSLVFSGGNSGGSGASITAALSNVTGSGASLTANMSSGSIASVNIVNGGSNYSQFTSVTVQGPGLGGGHTAVLGLTINAGVITAVTVVDPGASYGFTPTITVSDSGQFFVTSASIVAAGAGYSNSILVVASGGGSPVAQASLRANLTNGSISSVTILNGGIYGSNSAPTVTVTDPQVTAAGFVTLMPFAIQGTTIQTYAGRVWIANAASVFFSAPGSLSNFATSAGGGNFISSDSFLRVAFSQLISTNGFLYLIGDSSINYISGVQTSGNPPTTTFTNQNADPQTGTPYASTGDVFGRNVIFANSFGVHVTYGAQVTKVSEELDGVWPTATILGSFQLSAANGSIFNRRVWVVLVPIVDPIFNIPTNKLFLWDGKRWFASAQDINLIYIAHQEINSVFTIYGTDGQNIYPLFQQPSINFGKTFQSKLWDQPGGYLVTKTATRFWALVQYYSATNTNLVISPDNEINAYPYVFAPNTYTITGPSGLGYFATPPDARFSQTGVLTGFTLNTRAADAAIISATMQDEVGNYRG